MDEEWKPVVGFESAYEVSTHGRVRSLPRIVNFQKREGFYTKKGALMRQRIVNGYDVVSLQYEGVIREKGVHVLVLEAFVGPSPEGHEACHWDGDKLNNRKSNLRWGTKLENEDDRRRHGTIPRGEQQKTAKLTDGIIPVIRERIAKGEAKKALAREYGVSDTLIRYVAMNKIWKHVERNQWQ